MPTQVKRSSRFGRLVFSIGLLILAIFIFQYRQTLLDQVIVWRYQPTPTVAAVSARAQLSDSGEFLFYASQPQVLTRTAFNDACRSRAQEQTAVLGCYTNNNIYLFAVENQKLDGIEEVTAAHEMLHAAYQRLSSSERSKVNALLEKQSLGANKARIDELMVAYAKTEPGERLNELHSIVGSEIGSLDPALEAYYGHYFTNRSKLIALSDQYQAVFTQLKNRQDSLVSELTSLADTIEQETASYKRNLQELDADIESFNTKARSGTMTREEYDTTRSELESRQLRLKNSYNSIQSLFATYDEKRTELAAINTESNVLNRSINSSIKPSSDSIDG